jgi:hypothetical protein
MNRLAGIVFAAAGFILAIISITGILPGLTQVGVVMILGGGLMIGLSFINKPESAEAERMSTPSTLGNIFFSPGEVFSNLRRHPRWLVALLVMVVMSSIYTNLFMEKLGPERITNHAIDKTMQMGMIANNEQAKAQIEAGRPKAIADAKNPVLRGGQVVSSFVGSIFLYTVIAGIFMLFALAMGGKLNFWQAFAAAVYAAFPVAVIRFILNSILLYLKDEADIHPILGQQSLIQDNLSFLVAASENPVIYTVLASFGLLMFYWIALNAIGLKNAGEKVSGSIAWTASIAIFVILLMFGVLMALLFPAFLS